MRILVVAPGPRFSTYDTFRYYTSAFRELGHTVFTFNYHDHYGYHATALSHIEDLDPEDRELQAKAIVIAAEDLIARIARKQPDVVFVVSALALPPAVWDWFDDFRTSMRKPFTTMVLFTESPYIEEAQLPILERTDLAATIDLTSLDEFKSINPNSIYVRHAYSQGVHAPRPRSRSHAADVFMVGTGFPERIELLAGVDWGNIDFRLFGGNWGDTERSKDIDKFYTPEFLDNIEDVSRYYSNARISLNIFRTAKWPGENILHIKPGLAQSASPRCYEIMACGGFLLTDARPELLELFVDGRDMVVFDGVDDLDDKIKYYLSRPRQRVKIATSGMKAVAGHTNIDRAQGILDYLDNYWRSI